MSFGLADTNYYILNIKDTSSYYIAPLGKETANPSSILALKTRWPKKPGGLWSMGSESDTTERTHTCCIAWGPIFNIR